VPQIPLDFLVPSSIGIGPSSFALEVETTQLLQALRRIAPQPSRKTSSSEAGDWLHLQYNQGILSLSAADASLEIRAAGSWPQVISVARTWALAVLRFPLPQQLTVLRVENGKLFAQDLGVACIIGADPQDNEALAERQRHVGAAAAALNRYGVSTQEIEELMGTADPDVARLWGHGDDKIIRDVANAWQCLASYGVEASAIRRLLVRKSRDLWKDSPKRPTP